MREMPGRFNVLPEGRLVALRPVLEARLKEAAKAIVEADFAEFFDDAARRLLVEGITRTGADEGTLWLLDETRRWLLPHFSNGPHAAQFVGSFRQSLGTGMISMVAATEQPICENEVHHRQVQDKTLDAQLGLRTCAMLAVPFYFAAELRGVISAVQLLPADASELKTCGFRVEDLQGLQFTATALGRFVDHRLLTLCLGLEGVS